MAHSAESAAGTVAGEPTSNPAGANTAVVDVDQAQDLGLETVDLKGVAPHPANPRKDLGDLSDLTPSIREQGVLQPPVLLPADRVAGAWPQHAEKLAGKQWVVLIGHRRRAAALAVGRTEATALIRRDAIADDPLAQVDAMIGENTARKPLTPVEEARAFAEQMAAGRTQSEVADKAGRSQGHVSKRLKLLRLPTSMLNELEDGQDLDDDGGGSAGTDDKPRLEIGEALEYVDAAKDDRGGFDQFVMLAAYKMAKHRPHWSPAQLAQEVRREQARRIQREALARQAAAEGVKVIEDPYKTFGSGSWEHQLAGKKAIAKARKDGTLVAAITDGGLVYYSTAKPKKADNRSEAEQQRITDERERRKAMSARAEAAAILAGRPPKLSQATAGDIVDAWVAAANNEARLLARTWLIEAGAGPDPQLSPYPWWEQLRADADWSVRVHAAHALALANHEVRARATFRQWTAADAAWLARLTEQAGYAPRDWEQARLAAITKDGTDGEAAAPQIASLAFDHDGDQCWALFYNLDVDEPGAWAKHLEDPDAVEAAKAWAAELLDDEYGLQVTGWQPGQLVKGHPALLATFADRPAPAGHIAQDGDVLTCRHCGEASDSIYADGDPLKAVVRFTDRHHGCQPSAGGLAGVGEYRLLFSMVDDAWLLLRGDEHLADHDGLPEQDVDAAHGWAAEHHRRLRPAGDRLAVPRWYRGRRGRARGRARRARHPGRAGAAAGLDRKRRLGPVRRR